MSRLATVLCLTASVCLPQSPSTDPLLAWLDRIAQQQLDGRERAIAAIRTQADADRRKAMVRAKLTELIGGLPTYNGPLNARVTGRLQSDTHTIEKVIFESLPGFYITANLYRPNIPGRYPAVLVPSGHTQEGKPETQIVAANLAAKGFIALAYDPIGQGEREQTYLPQLGRALSGGGGNEHLELGARNILIGQSVARYFIFDAKRAVDYLVSRPDVDPDRIGVTGCSGGGAITTYVGVFEPRVKAAAPGCFINSFRTLFTGPTADSEMSFPAFLASGLDMADFFEVAAPLPWLMMATTEDYFPPDGARAVYTEARRWYELYGAGGPHSLLRRHGTARNAARLARRDLSLDDPLARRRQRRPAGPAGEALHKSRAAGDAERQRRRRTGQPEAVSDHRGRVPRAPAEARRSRTARGVAASRRSFERSGSVRDHHIEDRKHGLPHRRDSFRERAGRDRLRETVSPERRGPQTGGSDVRREATARAAVRSTEPVDDSDRRGARAIRTDRDGGRSARLARRRTTAVPSSETGSRTNARNSSGETSRPCARTTCSSP